MGIPGLWKIIDPSVRKVNFEHLVLEKGFLVNDGSRDGLYRVGVDASIFLNQAQTTHLHHHAQAGVNPELRQLFYRLANLSKLPLTPIFIFDGPGRPLLKRRKRVLTKAHWLTEPFQAMISAFGFYVHEAPGEAEAELAHLNQIGVIDSVLTNDSDTIVFGALSVIKIPNLKEDGEMVSIVSMDRVRDAPVLLTPGGLILFALLTGGDYHNGVKGFGPQISHGLAKVGFGDELLAAYNTHQPESRGFKIFLSDWVTRLQLELRFNTSGKLQQCQPMLANSIPAGFPNIDILALYAQPLTSGITATPVAHNSWVLKQPDIGRIASICELHFGWESQTTIEKKLQGRLLEGAVMCMLMKPVDLLAILREYHHDRYKTHELDRSMVIKITNHSAAKSYYSVQVSTAQFITLAISGIRGLRGHKTEYHHTKTPTHIKISAPILDATLPNIVQQYKQEHRSKLDTVKRKQASREGQSRLHGHPKSTRAVVSGGASKNNAVSTQQEVIDLTLDD